MTAKAETARYRTILAALKRGEDLSSADWELFRNKEAAHWAELGSTPPSTASATEVQDAMNTINDELFAHMNALLAGTVDAKAANRKSAAAGKIIAALGVLLTFYAINAK